MWKVVGDLLYYSVYLSPFKDVKEDDCTIKRILERKRESLGMGGGKVEDGRGDRREIAKIWASIIFNNLHWC